MTQDGAATTLALAMPTMAVDSGFFKSNFCGMLYLQGNTTMRRDEIPKIKDMILETLGESCEKIILFGSYAYGTPCEESDIDIYVVLKDGSKNPWLIKEDIYCALGDHKFYEVDVLANYKSNFEYRSTGPTMERTIANKGVVLYAR